MIPCIESGSKGISSKNHTLTSKFGNSFCNICKVLTLPLRMGHQLETLWIFILQAQRYTTSTFPRTSLIIFYNFIQWILLGRFVTPKTFQFEIEGAQHFFYLAKKIYMYVCMCGSAHSSFELIELTYIYSLSTRNLHFFLLFLKLKGLKNQGKS